MKLPLFSVVALSAALASVGCERKTVVVEVAPPTPVAEPVAKTKTLETLKLGKAVDAYEREPSAEHQADFKKALADLDGEIAELEALVAKREGSSRDEAAEKLKNMHTYRAGEVARFTAAQVKAPLAPAPAADGRSGADKVEDKAKDVGNSIKDAVHKTGDAIKDAVH